MNANPDPRWTRTRQALLEGGRRVMARKGVDAATILEIVREAGVSQPSFYNHFPTKEALAQAIASDFFQRDAEFKKQVFATADSAAIAIAANCLHTLDVASSDPVVAWVLVHTGATRNLLASSGEDDLVRMIQAGMDDESFRVNDPRTAALMIRGATFPVLQEILQNGTSRTTEQQFALLVLQMLGVRPHRATRVCDKATRLLATYTGQAA